MAEFVSITGIKSLYVWIDRVVARLPETAGKDMIIKFAEKTILKIRTYASQDAIYHSEHPGRLGRSFHFKMKSPYMVSIDSNYAGAEVANNGMLAPKKGKVRVKFPGGKWRTLTRIGKKRGGTKSAGSMTMTKSRALHFVESAVADVTRKMDGIIDQSFKKQGF